MRVLGMVCLAACGRIGFSGHGGDAAIATSDTARDVPIADTSSDTAALCTATLCDGFDMGIDASWTVDIYAGSTAPATTPVHSGSHSVGLVTNLITSSTTNPRATLQRFAPLPLAGSTIYLRAWLYLASPFDTTTSFAQFINFANTSGTGISIGSRHNVLTANDYTDGGYMESATTALPLDRWFCLEMAMPNGSTSTVRAYVDGTEVTDIALAKTIAQPVSDQVYVGFMWVNTISSQPQELGWLDDVALSTSPIGCN